MIKEVIKIMYPIEKFLKEKIFLMNIIVFRDKNYKIIKRLKDYMKTLICEKF
jgi:hypothetical protein